jgi:hypothetical protein
MVRVPVDREHQPAAVAADGTVLAGDRHRAFGGHRDVVDGAAQKHLSDPGAPPPAHHDLGGVVLVDGPQDDGGDVTTVDDPLDGYARPFEVVGGGHGRLHLVERDLLAELPGGTTYSTVVSTSSAAAGRSAT